MMYIKIYAVLVPLLVVMDVVWLGTVMKDFYRANIGHLMSPTFSLPPAALFYLMFAGALIFFVIAPGIATGSLVRTVLTGAAFGFVAYATYDLTNQATLKDWPLVITLADIAWGTVVSAVASGVGFLLR